MSAFDRRVDPEVREVRRLEVITGALGRRRWSAEAKARIVAESLAPGVVISEVARRHDLRPQQLFAWRHQARQGRLVLPAEELAFVPVVRTAAEAPPAANSAPPAGIIEVVLGGAVVRVPPEVDGRLLAKVLRAVKAAGVILPGGRFAGVRRDQAGRLPQGHGRSGRGGAAAAAARPVLRRGVRVPRQARRPGQAFGLGRQRADPDLQAARAGAGSSGRGSRTG